MIRKPCKATFRQFITGQLQSEEGILDPPSVSFSIKEEGFPQKRGAKPTQNNSLILDLPKPIAYHAQKVEKPNEKFNQMNFCLRKS